MFVIASITLILVLIQNLIPLDGVLISVLALSDHEPLQWCNVEDCEFKSPSGQTKDYEIGICCFSSKHTAFRRKSWLSGSQNNVSKMSGMSSCRLLFQWASTRKIQLNELVQYNHHHHLIKSNLFMTWYSWKLLTWH